MERAEIRVQLVELLSDIREDVDRGVPITDQTGIFRDLGYESIDAIGLSTAIEGRFDQPFPFTEFMLMMKHANAPDITVGQLLDFVAGNLRARAPQSA